MCYGKKMNVSYELLSPEEDFSCSFYRCCKCSADNILSENSLNIQHKHVKKIARSFLLPTTRPWVLVTRIMDTQEYSTCGWWYNYRKDEVDHSSYARSKDDRICCSCNNIRSDHGISTYSNGTLHCISSIETAATGYVAGATVATA